MWLCWCHSRLTDLRLSRCLRAWLHSCQRLSCCQGLDGGCIAPDSPGWAVMPCQLGSRGACGCRPQPGCMGQPLHCCSLLHGCLVLGCCCCCCHLLHICAHGRECCRPCCRRLGRLTQGWKVLVNDAESAMSSCGLWGCICTMHLLRMRRQAPHTVAHAQAAHHPQPLRLQFPSTCQQPLAAAVWQPALLGSCQPFAPWLAWQPSCLLASQRSGVRNAVQHRAASEQAAHLLWAAQPWA